MGLRSGLYSMTQHCHLELKGDYLCPRLAALTLPVCTHPTESSISSLSAEPFIPQFVFPPAKHKAFHMVALQYLLNNQARGQRGKGHATVNLDAALRVSSRKQIREQEVTNHFGVTACFVKHEAY